MTKKNFQKMLLMLGENFSGSKVTAERIKTMTDLAEKVFGFDHDWEKVTLAIVANESFFPNIATIKKYIPGEKLRESQDPGYLASVLVDRFLAYLSGSLERDDISEYDLTYCRKKFNVDRFSFARGQVNVSFDRARWIEMAKTDFELAETGHQPSVSGNQRQQLTGEVGDLINSTIKNIGG